MHLGVTTCAILAGTIPTLMVAVAVERAALGRVGIIAPRLAWNFAKFQMFALCLSACAFTIAVVGVQSGGLSGVYAFGAVSGVATLWISLMLILTFDLAYHLVHAGASPPQRRKRKKRKAQPHEGDDPSAAVA